ncbi:MAG: DUF58 domain-containing protein [Bacteriovoracaceae bacterium]|nr:DUF58 domain-containing protein [Bacteriovoracaceae bacterium]
MKFIDSSKKYLSRRLQTSYGRVYILPTGHGGYFIAIIFILFIISLSYGHSLAFSSTFLFVSIVMTSSIYTHFNLKDVELKNCWLPESIEAGQDFYLDAELNNPTEKKRYDIEINKGSINKSISINLEGKEYKDVQLEFKGMERGKYNLKSISLKTTFPFGIFYSWSYGKVNKDFIVHPKIEPLDQLEKYNLGETFDITNTTIRGDNDFEGHSSYNEGDPVNRIDWKVFARTKKLMKKDFISPVEKEVIINPKMIDGIELEKGLQFLAGILDAARIKGWKFGIEWDGVHVQPDVGREHFITCMNFLGSVEKEVVYL